MKKVFALIFLLVFNAGCVFGPGMQDYSYNVSDGYKLCRASVHEIVVVPVDGNDGSLPEIGAKVVEVAWSERYTIVKQLGLKPSGPFGSYEVANKKDVQYWILDSQEVMLFGPYNLDDFNAKKEELGITELKLEDVEKFKGPQIWPS